MIHWLYVWLPHPVGLVLTLRPVTYVGETGNLARRTGTHLRSSWWRHLVIPVPIAVPMGRRTAQALERVLVALLAPAGNREYNRGRSVRPAAVVRRFVLLVAALVLVLLLWLA